MNKFIFSTLIFFLIGISCSFQERETYNEKLVDIELEMTHDSMPMTLDSIDFLRFYNDLKVEVGLDKDFLDSYLLNDSIKGFFVEGTNNHITFKGQNHDQILIEVSCRLETEGRITLLSYNIEGNLRDVLSIKSYTERENGADNIVRATQITTRDNIFHIDILEMVHNSEVKPIFGGKNLLRERKFINSKGNFDSVL